MFILLIQMDQFISYLTKNNISFDQEKIQNIKMFFDLLCEWNQKINLTAIREEKDIWLKHFIDSSTIIPFIPPHTKKIIDIGTGAGFPGLVIAILKPEVQITLVDSVGKKITFLKTVIDQLALKNTEVLCTRAEDLATQKKYREQFDVGVSRAVALLPTLLEYSLPFIKKQGIFIAQKQKGDEDEQSTNALSVLGGNIQQKIALTVEHLSPRELIIVQKTHTTPSEYPRKEGLPKRRPL